ncbi:glycosyltransferase [Pontibacter sp. H259]|uniref:glycosyltransferase n=1 Tax=Pontibacter sp. H259 TaxID=3133421 RepID=UPI0030BC376E
MNVFVIPAWYPTAYFPLTGIFVKEQQEVMAIQEPGLTIGVSIWGQLDTRYLLWIKNPVQSLQKVWKTDTTPFTRTILPNLREYHSPTFTWTRKLLHGNRKRILKAMLVNYNQFEKDFGSVDIIHAHVGEIAGQLAMELARIKKVPYLITEHMGPFPGPYAADKTGNLTPFYREPYLNAAANIAVSPFQKQEMARQQIPNITIVPNFVDESFFKPGPEVVTQPFTFFTLARLIPEKGIDQLLQAFKLVFESDQTVKLRIGGDGPYLADLKDLAKTCGVDASITWLGKLTREQAQQEYQQCNAFVLPSQYETFGMVYAEAIACGKPIIATRCGGPESIVTEQNGLLTNKGDVYSLAEAMKKMMKNDSQYKSDLIREDFINRFSAKAVVPRLKELYRQLSTQTALRTQ